MQKLSFKKYGTGPPLFILHGLFGSGDNWRSQARVLGRSFTVYAVDLRNHGDSPHHIGMDYPVLAGDVIDLIDAEGFGRVDLLGHSVGGKVAMQVATNDVNRVNRLVVVDIAPKSYPLPHRKTLDALQNLDVSKIKSRKQADDALRDQITNKRVRIFLLMNLVRGEDNSFRWRMNLAEIAEKYAELCRAPDCRVPFPGPSLFIKGADSGYILAEDMDAVKEHFPNASLQIISDCGHWPHVESPDAFADLVLQFLTTE